MATRGFYCTTLAPHLGSVDHEQIGYCLVRLSISAIVVQCVSR